MAYLSKHTGAKIDALLDRIDGYPDINDMAQALQDLSDADVASIDFTTSKSNATMNLNRNSGSKISKLLPRYTDTTAGILAGGQLKEITDALDQVKPGAPFYVDGMAVVTGASGYFVSGNSYFPLNASGSLSASDTEACKKAFFQRFTAYKTPPCALLIPVVQNASEFVYSAEVLHLVKHEFLSAGSYSRFTYQSHYGCFSNSNKWRHTVVVTVYHSQNGVQYDATSPAWTDENAELNSKINTMRTDIESLQALTPLEIPVTMRYSGQANPSSAITVSASSNKGIYTRLQQGFPPILMATMETSSSGATQDVYLYQASRLAGGAMIYESGVLANGSVSNKKMRITLTKTTFLLTIV